MLSDIEILITDACRYASSLCSNQTLAEDLVQEAWLKVFERYGHDVERAVLYRTVRNLYIDRWRHEKRFPSDSFDDVTAPIEAAIEFDYDPALGKALMALPAIERETLFLSIIEGYTATEIATLMRCPRGSVLSRLHRGKGKLARALLAEPVEESRAPVVSFKQMQRSV